MFLAKIRVFDNATVAELDAYVEDIFRHLGEYFFHNELNEIESCFEGIPMLCWNLSDPDFIWQSATVKSRLKALMTSIIKNKGKWDRKHAEKILKSKNY